MLQTGRKGQRLKTIATYESKRNEAKLADLATGDVNADGSPDVVFTDIGEQSLEIATYAGDPELLPGDHVQALRAQDRSATRPIRSSRATWPSATSTATAGSDIVLVIHDRVLVLRQDPGKPAAKAKTAADGRSEIDGLATVVRQAFSL